MYSVRDIIRRIHYLKGYRQPEMIQKKDDIDKFI